MKYIQTVPGGGWNLAGYFDYVASIRTVLPEEVFAFASDVKNFDFTSHQSLHDAWLEWLLVSEPATGTRSETRNIQIECRFLGPYHDQYIELKYLEVFSYELTAPRSESGNLTVGHGDLLMHEVRIEDELVVHEMTFSNGAVVKILCRTFKHRVVLIKS